MNDPVKIIWKYKNNNRRIQYNTYIFIGNLVPRGLQEILNKIADLKFYDTMIKLHKDEHKKLEDFYGSEWYLKFFNIYHINSSIMIIKDSPTQKNELIDKFGNAWYDKHINSRQLIEKKLIYSYESLIKDDRNRKTTKKGRSMALNDDDGESDFTLTKKIDVSKLYSKNNQSREEIINLDIENKENKENKQTNGVIKHDEIDINKLYSKSFKKSSKKNKKTVNSSDSFSDYSYDSDVDSDVDSVLEFDKSLIDVNDQMGGSMNESEYPNSYEFKIGSIESLDKYHKKVKSELDDSFKENLQLGGKKEDDESEEIVDDIGMDEESEIDKFNTIGLDPDELMSDEEFDLDEIEKMYKETDVNPDENLSETTNLIKKALNDDKLFEKKLKNMVEFDQSRDESMYDENLKDVYKKHYVKLQYIFKDDTVKTVKDKICCGLRTNQKFDSELYLAPSRQYFWSEYSFDGKINKVMIGQKWMRRNELLSVDVEPLNNIRVYEELRGPLKMLRENIRRYNNKIRREDDEHDILYDYEQYITNNEIYMIDLYNELGMSYNADIDTLKNLQDIYLKIYFPKIKSDDIKTIIELLNGNKKSEINKSSVIFETINNDLVMENEISETIEEVKMKDKYQHLFKENYITQSVIHLNLRLKEGTKLSLFRVFNEFTVNEKYPFVQYQTPDGNIAYKFNEKEIEKYSKEKDNKNVLMKWFENAPYGISFKVKIKDKTGDKFMAIGLNENGRIEYKTQWKEEDMATIDDIKTTYSYVKDLITKINEEKNKVLVDMPDDIEFKFAFINTIQKFVLPNNYIVNHNDLSNFSRYFYPYVALVIEPRKRQAKLPKSNDKSKFGTYLRYKRVSKYENQTRIEQRIMYFIRNFEFTEKALANEISKQFNITEEKALEEYEKVKQRYPNIKKSRKVLKKLENIPKYKPQGIGIDIQGKQPEKYKIRISGARDKVQLERIIRFMNVLIYLYVETYHVKSPERQILKKKLEMLKNIAERRSKVDEIVNYSKEMKTVKQMTSVDKRRIGFKPEKGQNQWTRSCQNSGDDKQRRPQQYNSINMDELLKKGYLFNKKTGNYEKRVVVKEKGKKVEYTIKTVKLSEFDEEGNLTGNEIHYACDPEENGDHFYVGFLTRSTNPFGHCMPCCFKKDPMVSKNKEKQEFFKKCLGQVSMTENKDNQKVVGDRLYILQDTNKIQEGRFGFLPKYLDLYFNYSLNKQKKIKHHYLVKTETGYFFKYGSKQDDNQFMNAISAIFDLSVQEIKNKIITFLEKDKNDQIFTSLNNGDIKTYFKTRDQYIDFIKNNENLDFEISNDILSVPGVISKNGINMVIFHKKIKIIKKTFEKEKIREDFVLQCQNSEDVDGLKNPNKSCIFIVKENRHYYPIVMVLKDSEATKSMDVIKVFNYDSQQNNIVNHINDFYEKNCANSFMDGVVYKNSSLSARLMEKLLNSIKDKDFHVKYQFIDIRNKCKYLITNSNIIIPVRPSGSIHDVQIIKSVDKYISDYDKTLNVLEKIYSLTDKKIPIKPIGVYYDEETQLKDSVKVNAIMTKTHDLVPVIPTNVKISKLQENKMVYEKKPFFDKVDAEILKGRSNFIIDERINQVNLDKYENESYELFRLEFSNYINKPENSPVKNKLEHIMVDENLNKRQKVDKIKLLIYKLFDKDLHSLYKEIVLSSNNKISRIDIDDLDIFDTNAKDIESDPQFGGKYEKLITIVSKIPNLNNYQINNDRIMCNVNETKDKCNLNPHCHWTHAGCHMALIEEMAIFFVNKIAEELALNDLKAIEIMQVEGYFVSDIVDYTRFTEREGQKIIRSTSNSIKKVLNDTFGKDTTQVKIGRRKVNKSEVNYLQLNTDNPMIDLRNFYLQKVIDNNLSLFRAYVNGYYWIKNKYNDVDRRNLGYYSQLQTELANYFRSLVIDWLNDKTNSNNIIKELPEYFEIKKLSKDPVGEFIIKLSKDVPVMTNCIIELYVLSKVNKIPIVIYNDQNEPIYIFDKGIVYDNNKSKKIPDKYSEYIKNESKNCINIKLSYMGNTLIPEKAEIMYFK